MEMTTESYRSQSEVKYNLAKGDGVELTAKKIYSKTLQKDISVRPSEREVMVESVSSSTTEHSRWRTLEGQQGRETCHSSGKMLEAKAVSKKLSREEKGRHLRISYSEESEPKSQSSRKHSSSSGGGEKSVRREHHGLDSSSKRSMAPQHSISTKLSEREVKRTEPEVSSSSLVLTPLRRVTPPPPRISTQAGSSEKRPSSLSYKERERSSSSLNTFKRRDSSNTKSSKDENKQKKCKAKDTAARKEKKDRHSSTHYYSPTSEKSISNAKMVEMHVRKIRNSLGKKSRDLETKEASTSKSVHSNLRCTQDNGLRNTHEEDTQLTPFLPSSRCCSPPPRPTVVTKYWSDADETEDESDCEKHLMHVNSVNIVLNYLKAHSDKYYRKGRAADSKAMVSINGHPKRSSRERLTRPFPSDSQRRVRKGNHDVRKRHDSNRGRGMHSRYPANRQYGGPHEEDHDLAVREQYDRYSRSHSPMNGLSGVIGLIASLTDQQSRSSPRYSEEYERDRSLSPMPDRRRHFYRSRSPLDSQNTLFQQHRNPPSPLGHGDSRSRQLQSAYSGGELHSPWHKRRFLTRESHSPLRHRSDHLRNRMSHSPSRDRDSPLRYRRSQSPFSYRDHSLRHKEARSPSRFRDDCENNRGLQSPSRYRDDHVNSRSHSPSWYRDDHVNSRRSHSPSRYRDNHVRSSLSRSASRYRESSLRNRGSHSPSSYRGDSLKDRMSQPPSKCRNDCVRDSYLGDRGSRSPSRHRGDSLMDRKLQERGSLRETETLALRNTEFSSLMHERSLERSPELHISHSQLKKPRFNSELSQRDRSESPSHRNHSQSPPGIFSSYSESAPTRRRSRSNEKDVLPPWHRERRNIKNRLSLELSNTSLTAGNTRPSLEREQSLTANIKIKREKESCENSDYFFNSAVGNTDEDYQKSSGPCTERNPVKKCVGHRLSDPKHPDYVIMPRAFNTNTQGECAPKTKVEVITICDEPIIDPEDYLKDSSIVSTSQIPSFVPDVHGSQVLTGSTESSEPFALRDRAPGPSGISNVASSGTIDVEEPLYYLSDSDHGPDLEHLGNLSEVSSLTPHHEAVPSDKTPPNTGNVVAVPVEQGVTTENTKQDKEKASLTLNSAAMSTLLNLIEIAKEHTATGNDLSTNLPLILERIRQNTTTSRNVSEPSEAQNREDERQRPNMSHVSGDTQDSIIEAESNRRNTSGDNIKNDEERNSNPKDDKGPVANSPNKEKQVPKGKVCKTDTKKLSKTKDSSESQQSNGKGKVQVGNASKKPSADGKLSESTDSSKGPQNIIKLPSGKANNKPARSEKPSKTKDNRKLQQSINKCQVERSHSKASGDEELPEAKDNSKAKKSKSKGVEKSNNNLSGSEETQVQCRKKEASGTPPLERTIKKGEPLKNKGDLKETQSTNNPGYINQNKKETKSKKSSIIQKTFANMQNVSIYVGDLSASQKSAAQSRRGKPYNIKRSTSLRSPKKTPFKQKGERSFVRDHLDSSSDPEFSEVSEATKGTDTLSPSASSPQKVHPLHQETIVVDHSVTLCRACKHKLIPDAYTSISLSTGTVTMRCGTCHTFTKMEKVMPLENYVKTSNSQKAALQKKSPCIKTPSLSKTPVTGKNDINKETNKIDDGQKEIQHKTKRPPDTNKEIRKEKKNSQGIQTANKEKTEIKKIEKLSKSVHVYHKVATQSTSVSKASQGGESTACTKQRKDNKTSTSTNRDKDSQLNEDREASPNSFDTIDPSLLVFPWGSSRKRKQILEKLSVNDDSSHSDEEDIINHRRRKLTKRNRVINSSSSSEDSDDDTSAYPDKSTRTVASSTDTKADVASKSHGTT